MEAPSAQPAARAGRAAMEREGHMRAHIAALSLACAFGLAGPALAQEAKPVNIVVGFSPGGGYDAYARLLSRHYGRHLPGAPKVIVQNMPGASSLKAVTWLNSGAPTDGSVITAFNPGLLTDSILSAEKTRVVFTDFAWVGSISRDYRVCYAWAASGVQNIDDWRKRDAVNMGSPAAGSSSYINGAILKSLLGVKVRHVLGYPGSAEERLAIERGELDGGCGAWSSNPPEWVRQRKINPIVSFTAPPIPNLDRPVAFVRDLVKTDEERALIDVLIAPDAVGRPYIAAKTIPAERLAVLRKAFDATMADAEFNAEAVKLDLTVSPMTGQESEAQVAALYKASPQTLQAIAAMVRN
jgi:tripartite-type tricarboxylate transporter receptor subunit TctC